MIVTPKGAGVYIVRSLERGRIYRVRLHASTLSSSVHLRVFMRGLDGNLTPHWRRIPLNREHMEIWETAYAYHKQQRRAA